MSLYKKILEKLDEAGGYVPVNDKEAKDPRYELAVSVDVKPGEPKRQGAKFGFNLDKAGVPPTMGKKTTGPKSNIAFNLGLVKESKKIIKEGNVVVDPGSLRSYLRQLIDDAIDKEDDIDKLSQVLKLLVGKEIKARGKRYTITSDDINEALENIKLRQVCTPEKQARIKEFALYCLKELDISKAPRIKLTDDSGTTALGFTDTQDKSITVTVKDRHQMDIMRTLAHELVHYKQLETYMPDGATGSDDENEANSVAGVLLRNWGKQNPNLFYESLMDDWNDKKILSEKKPCWKGYKQIGMKKKGKKKVPNCVPVDEGFGDWFKNTFSGDPIFKAWYMIYKQDPAAAKEKFSSKHKEFLARIQKEKNESIEEGWGADEITPYSNGYTLWHRKQSLEKGMLPYWLYKTPEEFVDWDDSMKPELVHAIKKATPVAKLATVKDAVDIMNIDKDTELDEWSLFGDDEPKVNERGFPYYTGKEETDLPVVAYILRAYGNDENKTERYLTKKLNYPRKSALLYIITAQMPGSTNKYPKFSPKKQQVKETASAGATSSGNIASVANPQAAYGKIGRDKNGVPKRPQRKNKNGTVKNALDASDSLMAEKVIKR
jgi:hypothetical protein